MTTSSLRFLRFMDTCKAEMKDTRRVDFLKHPRAYLLQRLFMVYHNLFVKMHWGYAARLTFNTMMAIIPVFAIIFAVARGFGFEERIAAWCREVFAGQPQVAKTIVDLSTSYIDYTHTGLIIGIGLVFMIWSVVSLFENVEDVFNEIWGVRKDRSFGRKMVDYTAIVFLVPLVIVFYSGLTVFMYSIIDFLPQFQLLTPAMKLLLGFATPLFLLWVFFLLLYMVIPNTRVPFSHTWFPAFLGSLCIIILQNIYVHLQVVVTSYSIIYGSLAALPLFMIWLQASWYIAIGFAELSHANRNLKLGWDIDGKPYSIRDRMEHCLVVLGLICKRQKDEARPCRLRDLQRVTGYAYSHLTECLAWLEDTHFILNVRFKSGKNAYTPCCDTDTVTVGGVIDALSAHPVQTDADPLRCRLADEARQKLAETWQTNREKLEQILVRDCIRW